MIDIEAYLSPLQVQRATEAKERAQRAQKKGLVMGAKNEEESKILDVLRQDGPHDSVGDIVKKTGLSAAVVSLTISALVDRKLVSRTNDGMFNQRARISAQTIEDAATTVAKKAAEDAVSRNLSRHDPVRQPLFP